MKKLLLLAIVVFGISAVSFGQDTKTVVSSATIIVPISMVNTAPLAFGNIAVKGAGTVEMVASAANSRNASANLTLPAFAGSPTAAKFDVTGEGNCQYNVTVPTGDRIIKIGTDGAEMTVNTFKTSLPDNKGTLSGTTGTTGSQTFYVGATLNVSAGQAVGTYTGNFDVTINYN